VNRLIAVHTPAAELDGLIVISVELWEQAIYVHLARLDDEQMSRSWHEWADHAAAARNERAEVPAPPDTGIGQDLRITDDIGTRYARRPGPPTVASRLTITLGEDAMELAL
jgi:hypothetical protein